MRLSSRPSFLGALVCMLVVLLVAVAALSSPAAAAPLAELPTATPPPPTIEPSPTAPPPTATTPPPSPTATIPPPSPTATIPPTATPTEPPPPPGDTPERDRPRPSATPTPSPTITPSPTPSPTPGPATDIAIVKLADRQQVLPGGTVVFTLRVTTSQGSNPMADVVVRDFVPEPLEVIDLASDRGDIIVQGREVVAFPSRMAPGETVTIRITARVPLTAVPGTIVNTATVTTSTIPDDPSNNTSSVPVEILEVIEAQELPPATLPRTSDPTEQTLLMRLLPWLLVGVLMAALGLVILVQRRGWPLIRVPARGLSAAETAVHTAVAIRPEVGPAQQDAPARSHRGLTLGPPLPPPVTPSELPPRPLRYLDSDAPPDQPGDEG